MIMTYKLFELQPRWFVNIVMQIQRKWREKELETARKKQRETEELKSARDQQIREKREGLAGVTDEKRKEADEIAAENEKLRNELLQLQQKQKQVGSYVRFRNSRFHPIRR